MKCGIELVLPLPPPWDACEIADASRAAWPLGTPWAVSDVVMRDRITETRMVPRMAKPKLDE
jgi:hypothetical protein